LGRTVIPQPESSSIGPTVPHMNSMQVASIRLPWQVCGELQAGGFEYAGGQWDALSQQSPDAQQ